MCAIGTIPFNYCCQFDTKFYCTNFAWFCRQSDFKLYYADSVRLLSTIWYQIALSRSCFISAANLASNYVVEMFNFCHQFVGSLCQHVLSAKHKLNADAVDANLSQYSVQICAQTAGRLLTFCLLGSFIKELYKKTRYFNRINHFPGNRLAS